MDTEDTIAAIASAPGGAMRGVLRVSGPEAVRCVARCLSSEDGRALTAVRRPCVVAGQLLLGDPLGAVPCAFYVWPGRQSYTRQPSVEMHTFGSPPVLDAALRAVCAAGARLAQPGEFTLRAFLAGRLDLTQAEAVLGVIDARSRRELDAALIQLAGGLTTPLQALRGQLLDLLAHLEAGLDFVEEDIEFLSAAELAARLQAAAAQVAGLTAQMTSRTTAASEFRVVLYGWPNVGKSSLLNALVGEATALVSDIAGTTRDYVTRHARWHGFDWVLVDTAGVITEADEGLAAAAQALSAGQARQAQLRLFCVDATRPLNAREREELDRPTEPGRLVVLTKVDAASAPDLRVPAIATSSRTGAGLPELRAAMAAQMSAVLPPESSVVAGTAVRCRESLRCAAESLERAQEVAGRGSGEELVAAEVRVALDELGKVVGAVCTDDLLGRIFSRFCIGK
jgi:tRNA modification GTPase